MDLKLVRYLKNSSGVYGKLLRPDGTQLCVTLEHAYPDGADFAPKVSAGIYACVRGQHVLHSGPIETFEIIGIPGHTGILLHPGNTQGDSEGCVLLGQAVIRSSLINSRLAFEQFMALQAGQDTFQLEVT